MTLALLRQLDRGYSRVAMTGINGVTTAIAASSGGSRQNSSGYPRKRYIVSAYGSTWVGAEVVGAKGLRRAVRRAMKSASLRGRATSSALQNRGEMATR